MYYRTPGGEQFHNHRAYDPALSQEQFSSYRVSPDRSMPQVQNAYHQVPNGEQLLGQKFHGNRLHNPTFGREQFLSYGATPDPSMPLVQDMYYQAADEEQPLLYGTTPYAWKPMASEQKRSNVVIMSLGLFVPWILFTVIFSVNSFETRYDSPSLANLATLLCYCSALICGYFAFVSIRKWRQGDGTPEWHILLFVTSLLACCAGQAVAQHNYMRNMRPYYDIVSMQRYPALDPAKSKGQQLMDMGQVTFAKGSRLELGKSMGFRNHDTYCVAPVTIGNGTMDTYDFWAVGLNCCSGHVADFHCAEFNNPNAHSGLRLMNDELRSYFRLAVNQAVAAYNIKVTHPVFLHWMENPLLEVNAYQDEGYKTYIFSVFLFLGIQMVVVSSVGIYKSRVRSSARFSRPTQAVIVM